MTSSPVLAQYPNLPLCFVVPAARGGTLARSPLLPSGPFYFEQPHQFGAQIGCGARGLLPAPTTRARRHNSGFPSFSRESRPHLIQIDHLSHSDGSLGYMNNHNRSAFA